MKQTDELKDLSLLALLALGARCARRVSSLVQLIEVHAEAALCCHAVEAAVCFTEALAAGRNVDRDELDIAEDGAMRAVIVASEIHPPCEQAAYAANAAYAAISAARALLEVVGTGQFADEAERVVEAVRIAWDSANSADERVGDAAHHDWQILRRSIVGAFPDVGEPVESGENGVLGPLFPDEPHIRTGPTCGDSESECRKIDRRQLEAERVMLRDEVEKLRKRCDSIENPGQHQWSDLDSTMADLQPLNHEQLHAFQMKRDVHERSCVKLQLEADPRPAGSSIEHSAIVRIDGGSAPATANQACSGAPPAHAQQTLRLILDPGRASGSCIAEILSEVIALGRISGIAFAKLEGRECADCGPSRPDTSSSKSPLAEAPMVFELTLTVGEMQQPETSDSLPLEQFEASLRTIMAVRHGLDGLRRLDTSADGNRPITTIDRDAVDLPTQVSAWRVAPHAANGTGILPTELIRQLEKIKVLLLRATASQGTRLELVGQNRKGHRRCFTLHPNRSRSHAAPRCTPATRRNSRYATHSAE